MKKLCQTTKTIRITTRTTRTIRTTRTTRTEIIRKITTKGTIIEITNNYFRLSYFNKKGPIIGPFLLNCYISIHRFKVIIKKSRGFAL